MSNKKAPQGLRPGELTGRVVYLNTPDIIATFNKTGFVGNGPFNVIGEKSFEDDGAGHAVRVKDVAGKITVANNGHFDFDPLPPAA